jgi:hypothetical protein
MILLAAFASLRWGEVTALQRQDLDLDLVVSNPQTGGGNDLVVERATVTVSLADLMARMGHNSSQARMIYQHKAREADRAIAAALNAKMKKINNSSTKARSVRASGTPVARGGQMIEFERPRQSNHAPGPSLCGGAGEGNRTPTVSLGNIQLWRTHLHQPLSRHPVAAWEPSECPHRMAQ